MALIEVTMKDSRNTRLKERRRNPHYLVARTVTMKDSRNTRLKVTIIVLAIGTVPAVTMKDSRNTRLKEHWCSTDDVVSQSYNEGF